jgi:sugar phosphate permease
MNSLELAAPQSRASAVRYGVLAALCLAASIAYLSRNCLGVAVADKRILKDLNCSEEQMAWVMGPGFFLTYALFQLPSGWLGHAWGSRRVLAIIATMWSLLTGLMGLVGGFVPLLVTYLGIGAAQAGLFPNAAHSIKQWFPAGKIAVVCGALGGFMSVGAAIATALSGLLLESMSWRFVFLLFLPPGIVWAVWFYLWFCDSPSQHPAVNAEELALIRGGEAGAAQPESAALPEREPIPWKAVFRSYTMWMICGQQFFRAAGYIFYATWFPTYLKETRGVSTKVSGLYSSLPLLAVVAGSLLGGLVIDWILSRTRSRRVSRQGTAIVSLLVSAALIGVAYFAGDARTAVLLISCGSFFAAVGGPCAYAVTIDMAGKQVPIVFSTMNMAGNIGAALCPLLVVWFVKATGQWDLVLFFFAGIYLAAAVCWGLLNPTGTIFDRSAAS